MDANQDTFRIELKNDFREVFKSDSENALNDNIEISLSIAAFIEKRVTLARAAELSGKGLSQFIKILSRYKIPWMEYDEETFEEDQEALEKLKDSENIMSCSLCKGNLIIGEVNHIVDLHNRIIIIKNVPAKTCTQCKEYYVDTKVAIKLEEIIEDYINLNLELAIINYKERTIQRVTNDRNIK